MTPSPGFGSQPPLSWGTVERMQRTAEGTETFSLWSFWWQLINTKGIYYWAKILGTTKCQTNSISLPIMLALFIPKIGHFFSLRCSCLLVNSPSFTPSLQPFPDLLRITNKCFLRSEMPFPKENTIIGVPLHPRLHFLPSKVFTEKIPEIHNLPFWGLSWHPS